MTYFNHMSADLKFAQMIFSLIAQTEQKKPIDPNALQLSPIQLKEEYKQKWNEHMNDFVVLTKNGELVNESLYRVGGFGADLKDDYFLLLKYVEAHYDREFLKQIKSKSDPKHLEGRWCIIDKNGIEKKEFEPFKSPYIVKNSVIYSIDSNYYNIETDEFYCKSFHSMSSSEYLFLDNAYDSDLSRRGVMKINKKDGSWELYK